MMATSRSLSEDIGPGEGKLQVAISGKVVWNTHDKARKNLTCSGAVDT